MFWTSLNKQNNDRVKILNTVNTCTNLIEKEIYNLTSFAGNTRAHDIYKT